MNASYDPQKVIFYPRKKLAKSVCVGELVSITGKSGQVRTYNVIELLDDMIRLDSNYSLEAPAVQDTTNFGQ